MATEYLDMAQAALSHERSATILRESISKPDPMAIRAELTISRRLLNEVENNLNAIEGIDKEVL